MASALRESGILDEQQARRGAAKTATAAQNLGEPPSQVSQQGRAAFEVLARPRLQGSCVKPESAVPFMFEAFWGLLLPETAWHPAAEWSRWIPVQSRCNDTHGTGL